MPAWIFFTPTAFRSVLHRPGFTAILARHRDLASDPHGEAGVKRYPFQAHFAPPRPYLNPCLQRANQGIGKPWIHVAVGSERRHVYSLDDKEGYGSEALADGLCKFLRVPGPRAVGASGNMAVPSSTSVTDL